MSFRLALKSVTLNYLERRNGPYFALFRRIRNSVPFGTRYVKVVDYPSTDSLPRNSIKYTN